MVVKLFYFHAIKGKYFNSFQPKISLKKAYFKENFQLSETCFLWHFFISKFAESSVALHNSISSRQLNPEVAHI